MLMLYKFLKLDGTYIGTVIEPIYIKLLGNGYYGICSEKEAEGVAINNKPYHLEGREGLEDLETVYFERITEWEYQELVRKEQQELLDIITGEVIENENPN